MLTRQGSHYILRMSLRAVTAEPWDQAIGFKV
jgi:hypothetical protein